MHFVTGDRALTPAFYFLQPQENRDLRLTNGILVITRSATMIDSDLMKCMQVRYVKLHFEIELVDGGQLPKDKASMLRGGMGRMLLMSNCIRDENCENCDFSEECLVQRMMYAHMKIRPAFMTQKDSEGYVLECENTDEDFYPGDLLEFNLLLFGNSIVYFNQYLQAFHALGMRGLGKEKLRFRLSQVTNSSRELLLKDGIMYKERFRVRRIEEYVRYRLSWLEKEKQNQYTDDVLLVFHTPLTLKFQKEFQDSLDPLPIMSAVERRLYILNCYEGFKDGEDYERIAVAEHLPEKVDERVHAESMKRFSGTQNKGIVFKGIKGACRFSGVDDTALALLAAGELVHIGKNTSFGFGRYTMKGIK